MNCIVGILDKPRGSVLIGCDAAVLEKEGVFARRGSRVFRCGDFVIGCSSATRMAQILEHSFTPPEIEKSEAVGFKATHEAKETNLVQYLCATFVEELRACLKKGGFLHSNNGFDEGGAFLVGYKDRLFSIHEDFSVEEGNDPFAAIGPGSMYAVAAMKALRENTDLDPREIAEKALGTAGHFTAAVRPPFTFLSTKAAD